MKNRLENEAIKKRKLRGDILSEPERGMKRENSNRREFKNTKRGKTARPVRQPIADRFFAKYFENDVYDQPTKKFKCESSYADDSDDETKKVVSYNNLSNSLREKSAEILTDFVIDDFDDFTCEVQPTVKDSSSNLTDRNNAVLKAGAMSLLTSYGSDTDDEEVDAPVTKNVMSNHLSDNAQEVSTKCSVPTSMDCDRDDFVGNSSDCRDTSVSSKKSDKPGVEPNQVAQHLNLKTDAADVCNNNINCSENGKENPLCDKKNATEVIKKIRTRPHKRGKNKTSLEKANSLKPKVLLPLRKSDKTWGSSKTIIRDIEIEGASKVDHIKGLMLEQEEKLAKSCALAKTRAFRNAYAESLLEKILVPQIIEERNVLLQCVKFIVDNNFFEGNSSTTFGLAHQDTE